RSGDEGSLPGPRNDCGSRPRRQVPIQLGQEVAKLREQLGRQRIELVGPVQSNGSDLRIAVEEQGLQRARFRHGSSAWSKSSLADRSGRGLPALVVHVKSAPRFAPKPAGGN